VGRERLDALPGLDEKGRSRVKALIDRRAYAEVFSAYLLKRSSAKESMARYRGLQESGAAPRVSQAVTFWRLVAEDALARKDTPMASLAVEGLAGLIGGAENTSSIEKAVDALRQRVLGGN
jgi:hypothetical protein